MQDNPFDDDIRKNAYLMGIDPQLPFYDLNLAGAQGIPAVSKIASAAMPPSTNAPTFTGPDTEVPKLAPYDLIEPGIDLHAALPAASLLPDLTEYTHPHGLDILQDASLQREMTQSDPLLPDLQHPDLTQQAHMAERPGDLAADALHAMHMDLTYQQLDTKTYPEVFIDQSGSNTTRSRHMDLLMHGLDEEER